MYLETVSTNASIIFNTGCYKRRIGEWGMGNGEWENENGRLKVGGEK